MGDRLAGAARGMVTVAIVARPEFLDAERFAVLVARNRGLRGGGFATEAEAIQWLLGSETD